MIRTDLGIATAYAEAVSKGYTGTRDEFGQMFVDFGKTAEKVTEDKKSVEQMKASVEETKNSVDTTAAEFGQNVADKTEEAKEAITEHANMEKASATAAISEAKDDATDAIASAKDSATSEIAKKGTDTLATIPADYTALSKDVIQLKEDLSNKITKFYASNQGETHITDSDNGKIIDMIIYGKFSQDGTPSPENPVEIKSVVNPTVKVSNEDGTKSQTVTLPYTLNAIPVSSGGNVTIDGQQYIADYVDVERGKLVRMCNKKAIPNNVDWSLQVQSGNYKIGYSNKVFNDMASTREDIKKSISNFGSSSLTWSNKFCFGKSNVFWINPYANNGELTSNDINNFLTEHHIEVVYHLVTPMEEELTPEELTAFKALATYYPTTNISVNSEQLNGYTVFNYPISMKNGWDYVKKQLNDNRDYIYDIDTQSEEAYVNSEYAVALTELEV